LADKFTANYYEWARQKSEEEFRSGFPLLSLVLGRNSFKLIEFAGTLTEAKRTNLCRALLKRFHPQALLLKSVKIEPDEQQLIDQYLNYDQLALAGGTVAAKGAASLREAEILASLDRPEMKPDRAAVRKVVISQLKRQLGSPHSSRAG